MKFCKYCGQQLDEDSAFCPQCGKRIVQEDIQHPKTPKCKKCDRELSANDVFCPKCGEPIEKGPTKPSNVQYCRKCNQPMNEGQSVCNHCGTVAVPIVAKKSTQMKNKLHCPRCKSEAITPVHENLGTVGAILRWSENLFITNSKNRNRTSWLCHECGLKFRNPDDIEAEARDAELAKKIYPIITILYSVYLVVLLILSALKIAFIFLPVPFAIFSVIVYSLQIFIPFYAKRKRAQADEYIRNCFE